MAGEYRTLRQRGTGETTITKSRFIGYGSPAQTEEEALAFLAEIRGRHRDARHCCYAYIIGENAGIMRYSDDGEPGGTAGLPIISVLKNKGLVNCCVAVVRYFGGVLLGTGGLVRAYTQGCELAVSACGVIRMEPSVQLLCEIAYDQWDRMQHQLKQLPVLLTETSYGASVCFTLQVRQKDQERVEEQLTQASNGRVTMLSGGRCALAWPEE